MCCHHQRAAEVLRVAEIETREVVQNRQREHRDRRGRDVAIFVVFVDDGEGTRGVRSEAGAPATGEGNAKTYSRGNRARTQLQPIGIVGASHGESAARSCSV